MNQHQAEDQNQNQFNHNQYPMPDFNHKDTDFNGPIVFGQILEDMAYALNLNSSFVDYTLSRVMRVVGSGYCAHVETRTGEKYFIRMDENIDDTDEFRFHEFIWINTKDVKTSSLVKGKKILPEIQDWGYFTPKKHRIARVVAKNQAQNGAVVEVGETGWYYFIHDDLFDGEGELSLIRNLVIGQKLIVYHRNPMIVETEPKDCYANDLDQMYWYPIEEMGQGWEFFVIYILTEGTDPMFNGLSEQEIYELAGDYREHFEYMFNPTKITPKVAEFLGGY